MDVTVTVAAHGQDAGKVNPDLLRMIQEAAQTMVEKNTQRGDGWRTTGIMGNFIDLHTCYCRVRGLVWENPPRIGDAVWEADLRNALLDARNYTLLIELALEAGLVFGEAVNLTLACSRCGSVIGQ